MAILRIPDENVASLSSLSVLNRSVSIRHASERFCKYLCKMNPSFININLSRLRNILIKLIVKYIKILIMAFIHKNPQNSAPSFGQETV